MRSWLEVNLKNIEFNLNQIENLTKKKAIPVIKANAYGLDRKSTRQNSSHQSESRMRSCA